MIEFESVAKVYDGQRQALSDVNFRLAPGEMAFLTGHSGAGKSTLLRLILGLETASSGTVRVAGADLSTLSGEMARCPQKSIELNPTTLFVSGYIAWNSSWFDCMPCDFPRK